MHLTKEAILAKKTPTTRVVEIPDSDETVTIVKLSHRRAFEMFTVAEGKGERLTAAYIAASVINEDGSYMFSFDDIDWILDLPNPFVVAVSNAAVEFNGHDKKLDDLKKKSQASQS